MGSLCFIGLGLYDEKDISVKGFERVRSADHVFFETYTAVLIGTDVQRMESFYGRTIEPLGRDAVEDAKIILDAAREGNAVLLVVGDALTATTHSTLRMDALSEGIPVDVIHGPSIVTAVNLLGLQNYRFGRTTTLVTPEKNYLPTSPYDVIRDNLAAGLHSLVLLDIRADRQEFMTVHQAVDTLWRMEEKIRDAHGELGDGGIVTEDRLICAVCRAGAPDVFVWSGTLAEAKDVDFGGPLHTLIVPAELNFAEKEFLDAFTKCVYPKN